MGLFSYEAVDQKGHTVKGKVDAENKSQAKTKLANQGLLAYDLKELSTKHNKNSSQLKLSNQDKLLFTRQLATLLNAGFTLEKALSSCSRQNKSKKSNSVVNTIYNRVLEGIPLYQALLSFPKVFSSTFCATIKAGEESGYLDKVLLRLADHEESQAQVKDNIKQAMIYPIILFVISLIMITYLVVAVIPDVVDVFTSSGEELPALTDWLLRLSQFISKYGYYLIVTFILLFFIIKRINKIESVIHLRHRLLLKIPFVGQAIKEYQSANYTSTLFVLVNSGVNLVDALKISAKTVSIIPMQIVCEKTYEHVTKGHSLAKSLTLDTQIFPELLVELVDSGEQTAKLTEMLNKASEIFHRQSQTKIKTMTNMLGPLMILLMGVFVFIIVLAILLPIFNLNQSI